MNSLITKPIVIDTDITTYTGASAVKALGGVEGVRVSKIMLVVGSGSAASAGQVTITAPSDSAVLYPPILVGSQAAYTIILNDNLTDPKSSLTWRDFAVTGVTATKTVLYLWTDV